MKVLFTISLVFQLSVIAAQPTLSTGTNNQQPGQIVKIYTHQTFVPPVGASGANQTWDFSSLVADASGNSPIYDPTTSPRYNSYPKSTTLFYGSGGGLTAEAYYGMSADSAVYYGYYQNIQAQGQTVIQQAIFSDGEVLMKLPMVFNEVQTDSFSGTATSIYTGPNIQNYYRKGEVTTTYDSYGTIITPNGTFQNVVRTHISEVYVDTLEGTPGIEIPFESDIYEWWIPGSAFPVARHTTLLQAGFLSSQSMVFFEQWATDLDRGMDRFSTTIYPNPATDRIVIEADLPSYQAVNILIHNDLGQVVWSSSRTEKSLELYETISITDLPPGVYSVEIIGENSQSSARLVKN